MTKDIHLAAQALGRLGGLAKSEAKATAVRENGKLGGRPLEAVRKLGKRHEGCLEKGCL